jgi:hypothetical protein
MPKRLHKRLRNLRDGIYEPCPVVGKLGDSCLQDRYHGGKHTFPPNPGKQAGVKAQA